MKKIFATKSNVFLVRLLFGQIPLLVSTYLFLSRQFLNFSLVFQFLLVVINLASILVTVYLTREMRIREFEDDDLVSPRTNQLMFIGLTGFMSIICLYRGITAGESYQQLIAYIGAVLCLLIMLLLIWGLKYYKKQRLMKYKRVSIFEYSPFYNEVFAIQDVSMTIQDLDEKF